MVQERIALSRRGTLFGLIGVGAGGLLPSMASAATYNYEYDVLGRLTAVTGPDSLARTYTYDNADNRTSMTTSGGTPPNLWPADPAQWSKWDTQVTANGTIEGHAAHKIVTLANGGGMVWVDVPTVPAGKIATLTTYLLATPNSHVDLAIFGFVEGYNPGGGCTGAKLTGPGTLAQIVGGRWQISGLSSTQATKVQITWTNTVAQTLEPMLTGSQGHVAGDAATVADVQFTITYGRAAGQPPSVVGWRLELGAST